MDISARAISLTDRPQRTIWVTSVRMRREDRSSISSHPLADLGVQTRCEIEGTAVPEHIKDFVVGYTGPTRQLALRLV
jgi:hypothetical protein